MNPSKLFIKVCEHVRMCIFSEVAVPILWPDFQKGSVTLKSDKIPVLG